VISFPSQASHLLHFHDLKQSNRLMQTTTTSSLHIPQISMLLPQMLSHLIRATIPLPLTPRTSSNRTEVSSLGINVQAILVADTFIVALESLGIWGVSAREPSIETARGRSWSS
jgi:hypothetical protein